MANRMAWVLLVASLAATAAAKRPNILIILADDLGENVGVEFYPSNLPIACL